MTVLFENINKIIDKSSKNTKKAFLKDLNKEKDFFSKMLRQNKLKSQEITVLKTKIEKLQKNLYPTPKITKKQKSKRKKSKKSVKIRKGKNNPFYIKDLTKEKSKLIISGLNTVFSNLEAKNLKKDQTKYDNPLNMVFNEKGKKSMSNGEFYSFLAQLQNEKVLNGSETRLDALTKIKKHYPSIANYKRIKDLDFNQLRKEIISLIDYTKNYNILDEITEIREIRGELNGKFLDVYYPLDFLAFLESLKDFNIFLDKFNRKYKAKTPYPIKKLRKSHKNVINSNKHQKLRQTTQFTEYKREYSIKDTLRPNYGYNSIESKLKAKIERYFPNFEFKP